ncbi:MAG: hypothetical protein IJM14_05585 [Lachnospiraceae bacterium]|nr:hypothetical protein [Lachnospiraceae bacterium]
MERRKSKIHASLTVEAAFVVPIGFFALYLFMYLFLMMHTEFVVYQSMFSIQDTLYKCGTISAYAENSTLVTDIIEAAKKSDVSDKVEELSGKAFSYVLGKASPVYIKLLLKDYFDDTGRELSLVNGGADAIDCSSSKAYGGENRIKLCFDYVLHFPGDFFRLADRSVSQSTEFRGFYGYDWKKTAEFDDAMERREDSAHPAEKDVYIAPYGVVFHTDEHCTYISINAEKINTAELETKRNYDGKIYYPCEECIGVDFSGMEVYITVYGTRYHSYRNCPRIERNPLKVTMTEAENMGRRPCSKCVKRVVDE